MKFTPEQLAERLAGLAEKIYDQEKVVASHKAEYETLGEQTKNMLATIKASHGDISDAKAETLARSSGEYKNFIEGKIEASRIYHEELAELKGLYARKEIFITLLSWEKSNKII